MIDKIIHKPMPSKVQDPSELERDKNEKRNILYLLLILVGVNASELIDQDVETAVTKLERLRMRFSQKQLEIEHMVKSLQNISHELDELSKLDKPDHHRSRLLQNQYESVQREVQIQMHETTKMMQEILFMAKTEIEPKRQIPEMLQKMGSSFIRDFSHQFGTDIKFR